MIIVMFIRSARSALRVLHVGNGWWIDRIGASPLCYGWGFVVSVIAVGALRRGGSYWASLLVALAIIGRRDRILRNSPLLSISLVKE